MSEEKKEEVKKIDFAVLIDNLNEKIETSLTEIKGELVSLRDRIKKLEEKWDQAIEERWLHIH